VGTDTVAKENKCVVAEMKLLKITAGHSITDRTRKFITEEKNGSCIFKASGFKSHTRVEKYRFLSSVEIY
jgi:hypothetical protein